MASAEDGTSLGPPPWEGIGIILSGPCSAPARLSCYKRARLVPPRLWLPVSPSDLLYTCSFLYNAIPHEALTRGQTKGTAQSWTFTFPNCELHKPLFFLHYLASGILLQQQKIDQDSGVHSRSCQLESPRWPHSHVWQLVLAVGRGWIQLGPFDLLLHMAFHPGFSTACGSQDSIARGQVPMHRASKHIFGYFIGQTHESHKVKSRISVGGLTWSHHYTLLEGQMGFRSSRSLAEKKPVKNPETREGPEGTTQEPRERGILGCQPPSILDHESRYLLKSRAQGTPRASPNPSLNPFLGLSNLEDSSFNI